ncbi:MAG: tripartite tricarboxylate transporter substrate binding protein [Betaproteobacteria bacterium]|nr:tripartite tricarboxylate transporter substrate binding protein [Betaproteobacteria bacterium]MDH3437849.1 tripartite tricarboxylate transporter substrate binding protein [Betaproteobacteria bacterium]
MGPIIKALGVFVLAAACSIAAAAEKFPSRPMELICTTRPGSSVAVWCQVLAKGFSEQLGVPVQVIFKSGGSQHEPVLYVANKPADGHTIMHISASFYGYFHLPHYTKSYADFQTLAQVEKHVYGVAVRCDNPYGIKTYEDLVAYAKKHPGKLAMGSNKIGSTHHRHQLAFLRDAGISNVRFVPYGGDGDTVKDVVGGHLAVGQASPRTWRPHIEAGTVCPLVMKTETRLTTDKHWKDVRTVREVGLKYEIPHHWQGLMVKRGTPEPVMDRLVEALEKLVQSPAYQDYLLKGTHILLDLKTDRKWLNEDMSKNQKVVRDFMVEYKIIKK